MRALPEQAFKGVVLGANAPTPAFADNTLGSARLLRYLREQGLMNTHRADLTFGWYTVIDAPSHEMQVVANDVAGHTIDDVVGANPGAIAIINGTFFSADLPLQSEGYLRSAGVELPTSLPAAADPATMPDRLVQLIQKAADTRYVWIGTRDGSTLMFGRGHPPPASATTAIGRLLPAWAPTRFGINVQNLTGVSVLAYNASERAILVYSRESTINGKAVGVFDASDFEARAGASGFGQFAYLDGGSSVALYVKSKGVLVRGNRHKGTPDPAETVTSYLVFSPR